MWTATGPTCSMLLEAEGWRRAWLGVSGAPVPSSGAGVEVLADAVQRLAGVAGAEAVQGALDAVARTDLDQPAAHAGVEAVKRPRGWAAGAAAA